MELFSFGFDLALEVWRPWLPPRVESCGPVMRLEVRVHGSQIPSLGVDSGRPGPQGSGQQQPEVKKHMLFSTVNTFPTKLLTTAQRLFVKSRLIMLMA